MNARHIGLFASWLAAAVLPASGPARGPQTIEPSPTCAPIELSPERTSGTCRLRLHAGEFVELAADQQQLDVGLAVLDGAGQMLASIDMRRSYHGPERLYVLAAETADHTIRIDARRDFTLRGPGVSLVTVVRRESVSASVEPLAKAAALCHRAEALSAKGDGPSRLQAIALFSESLPLWQAADARFEEATVWHRLGQLHVVSAELTRALDAYANASRLRAEIGDRLGEAVTLNNIGGVQFRRGDPEAARVSYERSLPLRREVRDEEGEAWSLIGLGATLLTLGEIDPARAHLERALGLSTAVGDQRGRAEALMTLAISSRRLHRLDEARTYFQMALDNARSRGDLPQQATLLNQLGGMHAGDFGDPARGRTLLTESLELRRRVGDRRGEAYNLQGLANLDADEGRFDEAMAGFDRAAALFDTIGDRDGQGSVRVLASRAEISRGRLTRAGELAEDALNRYRTQKHRAFEGLARLALADVRFRTGAYDAARSEFEAARAIFEALRSPAGEASALVGLARLAQRAGRLREAVDLSGRALDRLEAVHDTVQRDDLRAGVVASRQAVVEAHVNALLALDRRQPGGGFAARAFQANDRWRARSLRDTLLRAGLDWRRQADPELSARETRLQAAINRAAARLDRAEPGDSATAQRQRELDDLVEQLRETRSALRQASPEYSTLEDPGPLDVDQFRRDHLEPGTLLLEFALGPDRSWVWAVSRDGVTAHALPAGPVVEAAARRARDLMVRSGQRAVRAQARRAAEDLSRLVLQPVAHHLHARRLVVVADGALHYIPFGALPKPAVGAATSPPAPLIASAEVVFLPSASVLPLLRIARATTAASQAVAVLADPVLSVDDPRVRGVSSATAAPAPSASPAADENEDVVTRAAQSAGLTRFERLPFSRLEAEAIIVAAGPGVFRALDFEANRATALATDFSRYQILHFATHALLNGKRPELSGIVLSTVDARGAPQDGFLRLHEIYGRQFGSRLVVLSGCQTALGQEIGREGLIGLTRGFMHAGASQVIASVWSVRDRATAELMRRFYDGLLRRKLPASAALRAAQRSMLDEPRWAAPIHWAGFVLQGDWRH